MNRNTLKITGRAYGKTFAWKAVREAWLEHAIVEVRKTKKPVRMFDGHRDGWLEIIVRPAKLKKRK